MKITAIRTVIVHAGDRNWVLVRVETDQAGLYGWGEGTLEWKTRAVVGCVEDFAPMLLGRNPLDISYLLELMVKHSFYGGMSRNGEAEAAALTAHIRDITGPDIEILIDAHGRFDVPTAIRLCRRLEDAADIDWFEEPVPVESYGALRQVRDAVSAAITVGERLHKRWEFVPVFENRLADYVMPDVTWAGGITELKKISTMAEAYYIPVSPHDASGPINVIAGAHVMLTVPNFYRLETSRHDLAKYNAMIENSARQCRRQPARADAARPRDRNEHGLSPRTCRRRVRRLKGSFR